VESIVILAKPLRFVGLSSLLGSLKHLRFSCSVGKKA
jgi:hypothetical protein